MTFKAQAFFIVSLLTVVPVYSQGRVISFFKAQDFFENRNTFDGRSIRLKNAKPDDNLANYPSYTNYFLINESSGNLIINCKSSLKNSLLRESTTLLPGHTNLIRAHMERIEYSRRNHLIIEKSFKVVGSDLYVYYLNSGDDDPFPRSIYLIEETSNTLFNIFLLGHSSVINCYSSENVFLFYYSFASKESGKLYALEAYRTH